MKSIEPKLVVLPQVILGNDVNTFQYKRCVRAFDELVGFGLDFQNIVFKLYSRCGWKELMLDIKT